MYSSQLKKEITTSDLTWLLNMFKENADKYIGASEYKRAINDLIEWNKEQNNNLMSK